MSPTQADRAAERLSRSELALLLACVLACRLFAWRACPIYDDAFITFRYAQNLAEGAGMVFNPGAPWEPVLGTTTPLFGVLLGLLARLGLDLPGAARAFNVLCDLGTALLLARAFELRRLPATLAIVGFGALPHLARISAGGMESPLFALLALASSAALAAGAPARAGLLAALTCTVRPEGVLLVGVGALLLIRKPRELLAFAVPVAAIGLATIALLNRAYGFPIPQSVLAKTHMQADPWERIGPIFAQSFAPWAVLWLFLPLAAVGWWRILRAPGPLRAFAAFGLAITASYLAARPHVWGWYFYVPLTGWVVALAAGGAWLAERALGPRAEALGRSAARALPVAALVAAGLVAWRMPSTIPERVYAPLFAWARATSEREPAARILASDIGAVGWAWRGTVLDSEGLTWPGALAHANPNAIIRALAPEYLLVVAERERVEPLLADAGLQADYEPVERFSPDGDRELRPAPASLPGHWVQDYLVYRRKRSGTR